LFVLNAGEVAVAVTVNPLPWSACTAVVRLVQPDGREKPAFE
jgi:hypothetical protein